MTDLAKKPVKLGMEEPDGFRRRRYAKQLLMAIAACVGYSSVGMMLAWPNVLASHIIHDNSTILGTEIHLANWQMDMTASMIFIGSMPGFLIAGWLVGRIGRRWSMLIGTLPGVIGATLIILTYNNYMLLIGRFFNGLTFGMMGVSVRTYVIEISDPKIRGSASIFVNILMQVGSLTMLSSGIVLTWYYVEMLSLSIMLTFILIIVPLLPESPSYLAVKGKDTEALDVLLRLRGPYTDIHEELSYLKRMNENDGSGLGYRGLLRKDIIVKIIIIFVLFGICNFSGVQVLKANTSRMLEASGLALERSISTIMVTSVLFFGNFVMMLLVDKLGRRYCLIISLSFIAVSYYCLGTYEFIMDSKATVDTEMEIVQLNSGGYNSTIPYNGNPSSETDIAWVPLVCLMLAAFGQSTGAGPLPFVLAPEYFPTNMRSQGMSLCTMMGGLQSFAVLQLYSVMQSSITQAGVYWTYATSAAIGIPFTLFIIKETSGKRVG